MQHTPGQFLKAECGLGMENSHICNLSLKKKKEKNKQTDVLPPGAEEHRRSDRFKEQFMRLPCTVLKSSVFLIFAHCQYGITRLGIRHLTDNKVVTVLVGMVFVVMLSLYYCCAET